MAIQKISDYKLRSEPIQGIVCFLNIVLRKGSVYFSEKEVCM